MSAFVRPYGLRLSSSSVGTSVANANAAKVSMIKFTHNICTACKERKKIWFSIDHSALIDHIISYHIATFNGLSSIAHAPMNATTTATTLTVNWNCKNFAIESYTFRPHITALTMLVKLSSVKIISDASFATSVPAIPYIHGRLRIKKQTKKNEQNILLTIAKPTSAFFNAGPSLVPSPVTATTSRLALYVLSIMPLTSVYLSVGEDLASTRNLGHT
ncbi:hypothetical protein T4D_3770 [Trichinella pseudospiralis]|uniref:Uncharacterized protein n=1 Tax=Trichinella pseudospiralis TaxID=6337 RepID=A0A0V1FQ91_TRIPS|nr:hypothetical protein T4D_3770 [Trichinella pseudospiralis]